MEFIKSQALRLPLASLPEEDKGGHYTSSTSPNSSNSPLRRIAIRKNSPDVTSYKMMSPKNKKAFLKKSKSKLV